MSSCCTKELHCVCCITCTLYLQNMLAMCQSLFKEFMHDCSKKFFEVVMCLTVCLYLHSVLYCKCWHVVYFLSMSAIR